MNDGRMTLLCDELERLGCTLSNKHAVEFFAREGDWLAVSYADRVASLNAWEINPAHKEALHRNLPCARVSIVDSYLAAELNRAEFDFVVLDNPQGIFGPKGEHCEHFDALPLAIRLLRSGPEAVIVLDINHSPYGLEENPEWAKRRRQFYGRTGIGLTRRPSDFTYFYCGYLRACGLEVRSTVTFPRNGYIDLAAFVVSVP